MKSKSLLTVIFLSLLASLVNVRAVLAHETVVVGDYEMEVGWLNEPPVVGLQNAIVIHVSNTGSGEVQPVENVSSLTVTVAYGEHSKVLQLQPLGEETAGGFMASVLPTVPGEYEVKIGGTLGDTAVDVHTYVEEVQPVETIQFPAVESRQAGGSTWLTGLSLLVGVIGIGLGITALNRKR